MSLKEISVENVLRSSCRPLILDQMFEADDVVMQPEFGTFKTMRPCIVELDTSDSREHVNTVWSHADLKNNPRSHEVFFAEIEQGCMKLTQRSHGSPGILRGARDPYVEITRCAGKSVCTYCVCANDEVINLLVV